MKKTVEDLRAVTVDCA